MPCRSDGAEGVYSAELKTKLDEVTRLLCALCKHIEDYEGTGIYISSSPELRTWWEAHKKADVEREAQEAEEHRREDVKRNAFTKLTKEERELLKVRE